MPDVFLLLAKPAKIFRKHLSILLGERAGNFAITAAILLVPIIIAVGCSIDFARAWNTKQRMQTDLDAALIAAVKEVDNLSSTDLQTKVEQWFAAQTKLDSSSYSLSDSTITISKSDRTITAVANGNIATVFLGIINVNSINVKVASSVAGPATKFVNVYIVLDKSASMLLPSTQTDRTKLYNLVYANSYTSTAATSHSYVKCEFACHSYDGAYYKYGSSVYNNIYAFKKAYESATSDTIELRTDTALTATEEVLDIIDSANSNNTHIKAGLYYFGDTLYTAVSPTSSMSSLKKALSDDSYGLTSATSVDYTRMDTVLPALTKLVGSAGDGSSAASPLKLVLILTDGLQSTRSWVTSSLSGGTGYYYSTTVKTRQYGAYWNKVAPMNPNWCDDLKNNSVTIGILNTEYLAIDYDWGYVATVGRTMASADWYSTWGGTMRSGVSSSTTRRAYLKYALMDCASTEDLFISASSSSDIESGLSFLFNQYLYSVRLTN